MATTPQSRSTDKRAQELPRRAESKRPFNSPFSKMNPDDLAKMDATTAAVRFLMERAIAEEDRTTQGDRFKNIDARVRWEGSEITLPATPARMTLTEGKEWLERLEESEKENIAVNEVIDAFPFDGAIAMMKALKQVYGWATPVPPRSFFEAPPTMMSVDISPTERTQIIWGRFAIPGIEGTLMTDVANPAGRPVFCIRGQVRKKYIEAVAEIAEMTRQIVADESIYRGKAVRLRLDHQGNLDWQQPPNFLDVSEANPDELIFSDELMEEINTNLFTPIIHTAICRAKLIPLKRGILMEGPFGTGKTLCAYVTARLAEQFGWTFIMIDRVTALTTALNFGVLYQPCVIFAEDIDRETAGDRTPELDAILNVIDGIASKGKEIMVVLTSNNAEAINRAMMRPGRLDAVLSIQPPDEKAAEKLMRLYGRGLIADTEALIKSASVLRGQIPAVIRECVERAKLYAISRSKGETIELRDEDLMRAANGMKHHLELLNGREPEPFSVEHRLGTALMAVVQKSIGQNGSPICDVAEETHQTTQEILRIVR